MLQNRGISFLLAILAVAATAGFSMCANAQVSAGGQFKLSQSVHWGSSTLPTGTFIYSIDSAAGTSVVRVRQIGGRFSGLFLPQTESEENDSSSDGLVLAGTGEDTFVASLRRERGRVLNFSPPNAESEGSRPGAPEARYVSVSRDPSQGYFTIFNPANEKVSYSEAEKIYLAVCSTVAREFNRSTPIRPRFTIHLHSLENNLRYPDRDLHLSRWDKNRFAEAVVELVLYDMVTIEDRLRLRKEAVAEAGATVNLCELKACN
ncbi:MAG TPA: hypothetical protein VHS08_07890 [Candidatus Acidoferrales bacterium]|nr:hypothetical protein [Candidatus Acidoferrales bacterium]